MVTVNIDIKTRNRSAAIGRAIEDAMEDVIRDTAEFVRDSARESMIGSGGGRVYGLHVASAPGRPPAIWTGQLFASIHTEQHGPSTYVVDASAPYAGYLEFGTTKMFPRPYMRPAARKGSRYARSKGPYTVKLAIASAPW